MNKDEALKLALSTLDEVRQETFRLLRDGQKLYAEDKVWSTIISIKEALAKEKALQALHDENERLGLYKDAYAEQEPVAWQVMVEDEAMKEFSIKDMAADWCVQQKLSGSSYIYWIRPLYAKRIQELETEQDCVGWFGYDTSLRLWFETNKGDDDAIPLYKRRRTHD